MQGLPLPAHLTAFLETWPQRDGAFTPVRSVWLEFDLDGDPPDVPAPIPSARLPRPLEMDWLIGTLLPALHGEDLPIGQRDLLRSCLAALPDLGYPLYAFSLYPRQRKAIRIDTFGLKPEGMLEFLARVAPWSLAWTAESVALFEGVDRLHLSFDLTSEVLPRIGIEGSFARLPERDPRWLEIFERLVRKGLCAPEKREASLAWSGYDTFRTAPETWPAAVAGGFCVRSLSHIKVVCRPDRQPEAKVYLAFGWLERSRTTGA